MKTTKENFKNTPVGGIIVTKVFGVKDLLKYLLILGAIVLGLFILTRDNIQETSLGKAVELIKEEKVSKVDVKGEEVVLYQGDTPEYKVKLEPDVSFVELLQNEGLTLQELADKGVEVVIKEPGTKWIEIGNLVFNGLFLILIGYSVVSFVKFLKGQSKGGMGGLSAFGRSPARLILGKRPDTTFDDVAGLKEVKEEIKTVVEFLKDPEKFRAMGARIPKGILLEGPPGTGKTLIARAVAGEAGVPFFYTSGGEFEEMLVGAGAARVRDLFKKARALQPSIIFIDEIDAVAKKRGIDFRSTYSEQTLNQILAEMDGLEKNDSVIVMAATNRADVLDPAIMRPGRFDWRIRFTLPDLQERLEILKYHARNKRLAKDVDLELVARMTVGFSGADLESTLNEAAILAVREGKSEIEQRHIVEGMFKVTMGPKRKSLVMTKKDLESTAYHEAGHAIVAAFCKHAPDVQNITVIPRAKALGMTYITHDYEKTHVTLAELLDRIAVAAGGRAAEVVVYGKENISAGAANDIENASDIARAMIKKFGMSEVLGFVSYANKEEYLLLSMKRDYSDKTAEKIDEEVRKIVQMQLKKAEDILKRERRLLDEVAKQLMVKETLTKEEFYKLVEEFASSKPPAKPKEDVLPMTEWVKKLRSGSASA